MKKPLFSGVCTALVTPFINGRINYPMVKVLLKRQLDAGVKAVVLAGTTGEAPTLTDQEKTELIRQCKSYAGEDCMIIAGTGSNSTAHAVELSIAAQEAGADALLVVSPYYNKATPDGLIAHFLSIAHSVSIPIILYNVPSRTGVDIPVTVYQRLSRIPNIVGVKEASTDLTKIVKTKNACTSDFAIWSGNDDLTVPIMSLGGQGIISVTSNICPEQMVAMAQAAINEDYDTAASLQASLQPLIDLMFCEVNPIPVKAAMECIGYDCGGCRLPLCSPSKENMKRIQEFFS
jgi:4-hydroxy-tetrahydrodipicolinate synthase